MKNKKQAYSTSMVKNFEVYDKQSFNTFMSDYLPCIPFVIYIFTM